MGEVRSISKRVWSTADIRYVRDHWQQMSDSDLAAHFKVTRDAFALFRSRVCGLKRSNNTTGLKKPYSKGNVPWNADRKGKPFLSTKDGKQSWFIVLHGATGERRVLTLPRYVWEAAGKEVPAGHCVVQVKGDPAQPTIEDLVCVDQSGLARIANAAIKSDRSAARKLAWDRTRVQLKVAAYTAPPQYKIAS